MIAGAALLVGSAGTMALWFDTAALGNPGDAVVTGDLRLGANQAGYWYWSNISIAQTGSKVTLAEAATWNAAHPGAETPKYASPLLATDVFVPGDAVQFVWAEDIDLYLVSGTTLLATLYLDGIADLDEALPAPLVVLVNGEAVELDDDGNFTIDPILTNPDDEDDEDWVPIWALPTILVGFPVNQVWDATANAGVGAWVDSPVAPFDDADEDADPPFEGGNAYGRNINGEGISIGGLSLRLQQLVDDGAFRLTLDAPDNGDASDNGETH